MSDNMKAKVYNRLNLGWLGIVAACALIEMIGTLIDEEKLYLNSISLCFNILWFFESLRRSFMIGRRSVNISEEKHIKEQIKVMNKNNSNNLEYINGGKKSCNLKEDDYQRTQIKYFLPPFFISIIFFVSLEPLSMTSAFFPNQIVANDFEGHHEQYEGNGFQTNERYSLVYLMVFRLYSYWSITMHKKLSEFAKRSVLKITKIAIRNPRKFKRRLERVLTYLRWIKYLAPIVGAFNKLKGNASDLHKKIKQNREARTVKKIKKILWQNLSEDELSKQAAIRLQSAFRAWQAREKVKALKLFSLDAKFLAIVKIQCLFRAKAVKVRLKIENKRKQLKDLEMRYNDVTCNLKIHEKTERIKLQQELRSYEKRLKQRKLLLRPDTIFAVTWRTLFVFTILLDILQIFMKEKLGISKGKLSLEDMLKTALLPPPQCAMKEEHKDIRQAFRKLGIILSKIIPVRRVIPGDPFTGLPDVCKPLSFFEEKRIIFIQYFIYYFVHVVSTICFLDVFVSFFTGELNDNNGLLEPKPMFKRWIAPGMLLQLLVNPRMKNVDAILRGFVDSINKIGPTRFVRWLLAFSPVVVYIMSTFSNSVKPIISKLNNRRTKW